MKPQLYLTNFMLTGSQNAGLHFDAKFNLSEQIHCFKNTCKVTEFLHSVWSFFVTAGSVLTK